MDTNMVLNASFNELVFENRHKNYGAYQIRKRYSRNVLLAGFIACAFFTSALGAYFISRPDVIAAFGNPDQPKQTDPRIVTVKLNDQPQENRDHPKAPKGSSAAITSNIIVTHDSAVTAVNPNDTLGVFKGITGGKGKLTDTATVKVDPPCINCDTHTVKRVKWVSHPPKDPGLDEFFRKNIHYPEMAKERGIEGVVYLTFVVDTKGDVKEIQILKGAHPLLDKEVLRVAAFMPKWEPVKDDNGELVEYQYSKPVRFVLAK